MKALTMDLVHQKTKTNNIHMLSKLNLWGIDLTDVTLVKEMPALQVLSLSVNNISNLEPFKNLKNLQELYLRRNNISDLSQLAYLSSLKNLKILWLSENPIANIPFYREIVIKCLPHLERLDDKNITEEERQYAFSLDLDSMPMVPGNQEVENEHNDHHKLKRAKTTTDKQLENSFDNSRAIDDFGQMGKKRNTEAQFNKKYSNNYDQEESRAYKDPEPQRVNTKSPQKSYQNKDYGRNDSHGYRNNQNDYYEAERKQNEMNERIERRRLMELEQEEMRRRQATEEQVKHQMQIEEEMRREAYKQREDLKRRERYDDDNRDYKNKNAYGKSSENRQIEPKKIKNDNVMTAILLLLGELTEIELEVIKSECEKKLDDLQPNY